MPGSQLRPIPNNRSANAIQPTNATKAQRPARPSRTIAPGLAEFAAAAAHIVWQA